MDILSYELGKSSVIIPPAPSGEIEITENGTYDVTNKASAIVDVSGEITNPYVEEIYNNNAHSYLLKVIMHGIKGIVPYKYYNSSHLESVELSPAITLIDTYGFYGCEVLSNINLRNITTIQRNGFAYCKNLKDVDFHNLVSIDRDAFTNCSALTSLEFSQKVSIYSTAFYKCSNLEEIVFLEKANLIANDAFQSCTKLTNIYVPWAEGAVSSAPWGATNATIHYNHTA